MDDIISVAGKLYRQIEDNKLDNYKKLSKKRLNTIIKKKIMTSLIGSLSRFEKYFRVDGESKEWQDCRNEILTNGNNQIRALEKELEEYDIVWNRHSIILKDNADE